VTTAVAAAVALRVSAPRRWASWEDYMREWCARPEFRAAVPALIGGEDPDFVAYLQKLVREAEAAQR